MSFQIITVKEIEAIDEQFRSSSVIRAGNTLYMSGQGGLDRNGRVARGREAQMVQAFENQQKALDAAGATWEDIVEMVSYHTDVRDLPLFRSVKDRYMTKNYPAWTSVCMPALRFAGMIVEIRCRAVLGVDREYIVPGGMEKYHELLHSTPAVKAAGRVYVSAQMGLDEDLQVIEDESAQYERMYSNLRAVVETAGVTMDDVVQRESFHMETREGWFPHLEEDTGEFTFLSVNDRYFTSPKYPAWTGVGARALGRLETPHVFAAMQCTAVLGGERTYITPSEHENHYENFHYTPVIQVGDTCFMTGQVGIDRDLRSVEGREAHIRQAFENQQLLLDASGTTWSDVVELVSYHTDMRDLALFTVIKDEYFRDHRPAWTPVATTSLGTVDMPQTMLEIKCEAIKS